MALSSVVFAGGGPLAKVPKFDGKFLWIKLESVPAASIKSLANAKSIQFDITFSKDVSLKKDKAGNQWFTFIVADQGSDWKWNQTSGSGILKLAGGKIKAGTYTVSVPAAGISKSVLGGKAQTISLGPGTSGLASPASFTIDHLKGSH